MRALARFEASVRSQHHVFPLSRKLNFVGRAKNLIVDLWEKTGRGKIAIFFVIFLFFFSFLSSFSGGGTDSKAVSMADASGANDLILYDYCSWEDQDAMRETNTMSVISLELKQTFFSVWLRIKIYPPVCLSTILVCCRSILSFVLMKVTLSFRTWNEDQSLCD